MQKAGHPFCEGLQLAVDGFGRLQLNNARVSGKSHVKRRVECQNSFRPVVCPKILDLGIVTHYVGAWRAMPLHINIFNSLCDDAAYQGISTVAWRFAAK